MTEVSEDKELESALARVYLNPSMRNYMYLLIHPSF